MNKYVLATVAIFVCMSSAVQSYPLPITPAGAENNSGPVIFPMGEPRVTDNGLQWRYQIRNDSTQDVWVCGNLEIHCCEAHMSEDDETFLIQRHLSLPAERFPGAQPSGRYIRLRKGETRTELVSFSLPIQPERVVSEYRDERPLEYATRVVLEVGYYEGDLLGMILDTLYEAEMGPKKTCSPFLPLEKFDPAGYLGGTTQGFLGLNNEGRAGKSEWLSVPYTWQTFKGERVLRLTADGVRIPYLERDRKVLRPDLTKCTRIEMTFVTPALEFFFPYRQEQSLFSAAEKQYLQSLDTVTVEDQELLGAFAAEVTKGVRDSFVWEHGVAELTCYSNDERLMSLKVYNNSKILTSRGQVFQYEYPEGLWSLSRVTPTARSLDLRAQCAANLRNLWYRLRLYHRVKAAAAGGSAGDVQKAYPRGRKWCDAISLVYRPLGKATVRLLKCPNGPEGRYHYAMNANCTYDSPGDMVLLFETKARWSRYGGPKLFTLDNHDPKGGLVLLNDGTVKFIRTEEELKQLRWK